jgi:hypothetical protein
LHSIWDALGSIKKQKARKGERQKERKEKVVLCVCGRGGGGWLVGFWFF